MSDTDTALANGTATEPAKPDELAALRGEVHALRDEVRILTAIIRQASTRIMHVVEMQTPHGDEALAKALADRDAYRLEVQHLSQKLKPTRPEDFDVEELLRRPKSATNLFDEVLASMEQTQQ